MMAPPKQLNKTSDDTITPKEEEVTTWNHNGPQPKNLKRTPVDDLHQPSTDLVKNEARSMEEIDRDLDVLEEGRRAQLEVECADMCIICNHSECTTCLKEPKRPSRLKIYKAVGKNSVEPCLACGAPTCQRHAAKQFRKEDVTICNECYTLLNWRIDPEDDLMAQKIKNALQAYKRAYLLLESVRPNIPELTKRMHASSARDSTVDLGSSSVGVLSGAIGLAGAATILTPVGAPLLLASTVLGASTFSTRVTYSISKRFQCKKDNSLANGILAAFGILRAVLRTLTILVDEVSEAEVTKKMGFNLPPLAKTSVEATKVANASLQVGASMGATHSATVFQYLGTAPVIGQVFSVAVITMEWNTASRTLAKMQGGSRSEKADDIERLLTHEFNTLPTYGEVKASAHLLLLFQMQAYDALKNMAS